MACLEKVDFPDQIRRANQLRLIIPRQIAEVEKIELAELQHKADTLIVIGIHVIGMRLVVRACRVPFARAGQPAL